MDNYGNKLVFVGGMGAGKTTAIRAISDIEPVSTDMPLSIDATEEKSLTTVALDYSSVDLDDGELLHVYGVPGQKYLNLCGQWFVRVQSESSFWLMHVKVMPLTAHQSC